MKSNSDRVIIPCEFCQKPVKSYNLENHLTICEKADVIRRRRPSATIERQPEVAPNAEVTFRLQSGPLWDTVKMYARDINLVSLHRRAFNFLCTRSPEHGLNRLNERLLLFLHNYESGNVLLPLTAAFKITEGAVLEVVVLANHTGGDVQTLPHSLTVHNYKFPTFCNLCGFMLFGLYRQGLKCRWCGLNFHSRCAGKMVTHCNAAPRL
ncbi:serine/threonine-protein kinase D3-like isoform X2 [Ixodes scapularis]|nr:serine/threonine-protein kinase D3-like isoform X2 [Ixodes scapularis]XP_040063145.1 serine/threonine-protein kinase D3-like isoform X2 [Ixodes scapularis]